MMGYLGAIYIQNSLWNLNGVSYIPYKIQIIIINGHKVLYSCDQIYYGN